LKNYAYREFWRLENAYNDFKDNPKPNSILPYSEHTMLIEKGQVFVIDYAETTGSVTRMYFRSDGNNWNVRMTTEEFTTE